MNRQWYLFELKRALSVARLGGYNSELKTRADNILRTLNQ